MDALPFISVLVLLVDLSTVCTGDGVIMLVNDEVATMAVLVALIQRLEFLNL